MGATAPVAEGTANAIAAAATGFAARTDTSAVALHLLDTLACALGAERLAANTPGGFGAVEGIVRLAAELGVQPAQATVWATGERTTVAAAALRNGVAARYLDLNDTYVSRAIVHPSDMAAVLVAQAENEGRDWQRLAEALTVGYETAALLADQAALRRAGFEASSLTPVAAAAGCAWLAGLSPRDTANALNIACLEAATLRAVRLGRMSHWKAVASVRGAVKGWFAVRAAAAGLSAPDEAFDSPDGFTARVTGPVTVDSGNRDARMHRMLLKQYPVQIFIQRPAALAARARAQLGPGTADAIAEVTVHTFKEAVTLVGAPVPADLNAETADHSLRFAVAAMLATGRLDAGDIHQLLDDIGIRALAGRVRVTESPDYTGAFPGRLDARLDIRLRDGSAVTLGPDGAGPDPDALRRKFRDLTGTDTPAWPWRLHGTPLPTDLTALLEDAERQHKK
jgi:2-methylcitrate dehydratase